MILAWLNSPPCIILPQIQHYTRSIDFKMILGSCLFYNLSPFILFFIFSSHFHFHSQFHDYVRKFLSLELMLELVRDLLSHQSYQLLILLLFFIYWKKELKIFLFPFQSLFYYLLIIVYFFFFKINNLLYRAWGQTMIVTS